MKAIRVQAFGNPEVMSLEEIPDIKAGPGELVVGTQAIGVNPVDTYARSGTYAVKPLLPYTAGMDAARSHGAVTEPGAYGKTILMP